MYLILTASKDTYITNKILNSSYRATDANVGRAGTLDLFKLYNESDLDGETNPIELSRILLKFNYDTLQDLTSTVLDITHPSFKCELKLYNVLSSHATPRNFNIATYALSQSFDEGIGRDVGSFSDLDVSNFVTASYSGGTVYPWYVTGANRGGELNSSDIDFITSGAVGSGLEDLGVFKYFDKGTEDLEINVTKLVSASMVGLVPNHGFRIAYSGTEETDTKTRFVKRFGSRHAKNIFIRPQMHVSFDDTISDHHQSFVFDVSGSLFLNNYHRSSPANILSGTSLTPLVGESCLQVTLKTGSFSKTVNASMHTGSTTGEGQVGIYSATFALPFSDQTVVDGGSTVHNFAVKSGSLTFDEFWHSNDGTVGFYTGSLTINSPQRSASSFVARRPMIKVTNLQSAYSSTDKVKLRVFGVDTIAQQNKPSKVPSKIKSVIYDEVYYRVVDAEAGKVVIPFAKGNNGTRVSSESEGMFFEFHMNALYPQRVYYFEFLVVDRGTEFRLQDKTPRFKVTT